MDFRKRAEELVGKMTLSEKISQISYDSPAIDRLGIPAYNWWNECLHGLARAGTATVFPQAIGMAASFNDTLLEEVADAVSDEARAKYNDYKKMEDRRIHYGNSVIKTKQYRCLTMFTPNINIFRDPRWGRGHETYGEDPYLTGRMGAAYVRGLQGYGEYHKVDATIKHYAVHSGPEKLRHGFDAGVSDEDLYNTYLKAFEYCIKFSDPASVMSAYNAVHGVPCSSSKELLCDILRGKFGFKGYVVSDCGAVTDIYFGHKKVNSISEAAAAAINNGCDLCLGEDYKQLPEAYEKGLVDEKTITEAAVKLMEARLRLGMQDKTDFDDLTYEDVVDCPAHRELNLRMARESIVLLKNNGILPLDRSKKIAVVGPAADSRAVLLANYNGLPYDYTTFLTGIRNAATGRVYYEKGCQFYYGENECPEEALPEDAAVIASRADVVIMIMGLSPSMEGEEMASGWKGCDRGDKVDLELPEGQKELLNFMAASGKPVIFVNVSGSAVSLTEADEKCDAVIQCFYPGARGGEALADVIFGNVSPSGKLPVTFYKSASDLPPFEDYSMKGRTYRYFEGTPLYPFAHGLSYTHFKYSDIFYDSDGIHCSITNDGGREAFETVLVFSENKYTELADFKKVFIKPGETVDILFETNDSYNDIFVGHCLPKYAGEGDGAHLKIRR